MRGRLDDRQFEIVDPRVADALRAKTTAERVAMIGACNETMRLLIEGRLRTSHPVWTDAAIAAEVARRMYRDSA